MFTLICSIVASVSAIFAFSISILSFNFYLNTSVIIFVAVLSIVLSAFTLKYSIKNIKVKESRKNGILGVVFSSLGIGVAALSFFILFFSGFWII